MVLKINALQKYCCDLISTAYLPVREKTLQMYCVFIKMRNNIKTANPSKWSGDDINNRLWATSIRCQLFIFALSYHF